MALPVRYSHSGGPFQRFYFRKMVAGAHLVVWSRGPDTQGAPVLSSLSWPFLSLEFSGFSLPGGDVDPCLFLVPSEASVPTKCAACAQGTCPNSRAPGSHLDTAGSAARTWAPACPESGSMKTVSAHSSGPRPALSILEMHPCLHVALTPGEATFPAAPRLQNASQDTREGAARAFHSSSQCRREAGGSPVSYAAHPTPHCPSLRSLASPTSPGPGQGSVLALRCVRYPGPGEGTYLNSNFCSAVGKLCSYQRILSLPGTLISSSGTWRGQEHLPPGGVDETVVFQAEHQDFGGAR